MAVADLTKLHYYTLYFLSIVRDEPYLRSDGGGPTCFG